MIVYWLGNTRTGLAALTVLTAIGNFAADTILAAAALGRWVAHVLRRAGLDALACPVIELERACYRTGARFLSWRAALFFRLMGTI